MKINKLAQVVDEKGIDSIQILRNPDNLSQWFVMIQTEDNASHILVDEQEIPITRMSVEGLTSILRQIGLKSAEVIF